MKSARMCSGPDFAVIIIMFENTAGPGRVSGLSHVAATSGDGRLQYVQYSIMQCRGRRGDRVTLGFLNVFTTGLGFLVRTFFDL